MYFLNLQRLRIIFKILYCTHNIIMQKFYGRFKIYRKPEEISTWLIYQTNLSSSVHFWILQPLFKIYYINKYNISKHLYAIKCSVPKCSYTEMAFCQDIPTHEKADPAGTSGDENSNIGIFRFLRLGFFRDFLIPIPINGITWRKISSRSQLCSFGPCFAL